MPERSSDRQCWRARRRPSKRLARFRRARPKAPDRSLKSKQKYWNELRKLKPDAAIILDEASSQPRNAWVAGAKVRTGILGKVDRFLSSCIDDDYQFTESYGQFERLLAGLGFAGYEAKPRLHLSESDERGAAEAIRKLKQPIVALHPGASETKRRWPVEKFAELSKALSLRGYDVVVTGSKSERPLCEEIPGLNLAGELEIGELAALLRRCAACFVGDTGPMHIAGAVGLPIVALYGPSDPVRTVPYASQLEVVQVGCACPYRHYSVCSGACMEELTVEMALNAFALLERRFSGSIAAEAK